MLPCGAVEILAETMGESLNISLKFETYRDFYSWLVDDVKDFTMNHVISYPLTRLEPYTQYAYYVTAYTLSTEKTGSQSDIQYFRTLPGKPQAVTKLKAIPRSSSSIVSFYFKVS